MKRKIKIVICVAVVVSIILIGCELWYFEIRKDVEISNVHFERDTTGNVTLIFNIKNLGEDRELGIIYRLCDPKSQSTIFVGGNTTHFHSGERITICSVPTPTWHLTWEEYSQEGNPSKKMILFSNMSNFTVARIIFFDMLCVCV